MSRIRTVLATVVAAVGAVVVLSGAGSAEPVTVEAAPCFLDLDCDWGGRTTDRAFGGAASSTT
jgi:hypothetical protein